MSAQAADNEASDQFDDAGGGGGDFLARFLQGCSCRLNVQLYRRTGSLGRMVSVCVCVCKVQGSNVHSGNKFIQFVSIFSLADNSLLKGRHNRARLIILAGCEKPGQLEFCSRFFETN